MIDQNKPQIDLGSPAVDSSLDSKALGRFEKCMTLKSQLRFYLDKQGMTAAELAKKSGVSKQVVSLWLAGAAPRKLDQVKKVADLIGVSIDNLCFGKGIDKNTNFDVTSISDDEWIGGVFEVKFRRVKGR